MLGLSASCEVVGIRPLTSLGLASGATVYIVASFSTLNEQAVYTIIPTEVWGLGGRGGGGERQGSMRRTWVVTLPTGPRRPIMPIRGLPYPAR